MAAYLANPQDFVTYGPDANCTLELCPIQVTIFKYRPALAANTVFLVLFAIALFIHTFLGVKWRTWVFSSVMALGCLTEVLGYAGRILMWKDPFDFTGFMMQICCITLGPTFFTAAIYLTLSKIVLFLGPQHGRFSPKLYYWIFIPCDIISLVLQAVGGAMSSSSSGDSGSAVDIAIAGLSFQVITLVVFNALAIDYAIRYWKAEGRTKILPTKFKVFLAFLIFAMVLIFIRCAFRIDELSEGYAGKLIHNEKLFIGLESVMIVLSAYALMGAHPGPVFGWPDAKKSENAVSKLEAGEMTSEPL